MTSGDRIRWRCVLALTATLFLPLRLEAQEIYIAAQVRTALPEPDSLTLNSPDTVPDTAPDTASKTAKTEEIKTREVKGVLTAVTDTSLVLLDAKQERTLLLSALVEIKLGIEPPPRPSWIAISAGAAVGVGAAFLLTPVSDETNRERNQPTGTDALFVASGAMLGSAIGAATSYFVSAATAKQSRQYRRLNWQTAPEPERIALLKELKQTLEQK